MDLPQSPSRFHADLTKAYKNRKDKVGLIPFSPMKKRGNTLPELKRKKKEVSEEDENTSQRAKQAASEAS
tara:strand:+ start:699 stop:908 length:210 start_codon:yes stop_codon:yes gene_type:complete